MVTKGSTVLCSSFLFLPLLLNCCIIRISTYLMFLCYSTLLQGRICSIVLRVEALMSSFKLLLTPLHTLESNSKNLLSLLLEKMVTSFGQRPRGTKNLCFQTKGNFSLYHVTATMQLLKVCLSISIIAQTKSYWP